MIDKNKLFLIGKTIKTRENSVEVLCEFLFEITEPESKYFYIEDDGIVVPFFIKSFKKKSRFLAYFSFASVTSASYAADLCGKNIYSDVDIVSRFEEKELHIWGFVGFRIIDNKFGEIGTITNVDTRTINTIFIAGNYLLPASENFLEHIDKQNKIIYTNYPDGIMDIL